MRRTCLLTLVIIFTAAFIFAESSESSESSELSESLEPSESIELAESSESRESEELTEIWEPLNSFEPSKFWEAWEKTKSSEALELPGAKKENQNFSIGVTFGVLSGVAEEIVYFDSNSDLKLSQLNWQFKPLLYMGLDFRFKSKMASNTGFFYNLVTKVGIPGKTGSMEDLDWAINLSADPIIPTYPHWLNYYSVHDNVTRFAVLLDFDAGVSFKLVNKFLLNAFFSYHFMFYYWEAFGGSYLYPGGVHSFWPSSEKIITYQQTWHILSTGVSFYGEFNRYFNAEIFFKVSPLIWLFSEDDHLKRTDVGVFYDSPKYGIFLEPGLIVNFRAGTRVALSLSYSYRFIRGSRGDEVNDSVLYRNTAGAAYSSHDVGVSARVYLF